MAQKKKDLLCILVRIRCYKNCVELSMNIMHLLYLLKTLVWCWSRRGAWHESFLESWVMTRLGMHAMHCIDANVCREGKKGTSFVILFDILYFYEDYVF